MRKIFTLLLALVMILSVVALAACGTTDDNGKDTQATEDKKDSETADTGDTQPSSDTASDTDSETTAASPLDALKGLDFGGDTVNVLTKDQGSIAILNKETINNGDVISYAVMTRELEVNDLLKITLNVQEGLGYETVGRMVATDVSSGTNDFDIFNGHMKFSASLAAQGYNLNLNKLPYIDWTQDYWNDVYNDNFQYKNYRFWATGDIDYDFFGQMVAMYVDDALWKANVSENMDDLFALVEAGQWTTERVSEYIAQIGWQDTDGDTTRSAGDTYGLIMDDTGWEWSAVAYGAGYKMTVKDGSKYKLDLGSAENIIIYESVLDMLTQTGSQMDFGESGSTDHMSIFSEDRALFTVRELDKIRNDELKMMDAYSTVPVPKSSDESEYMTPSYDGVPIYGVLQSVTPERYEVLGATLEALACKGRDEVTEAYFETALRAKYSKNAGSYRCLEIIREQAGADFAFCWTGSLNQIDLFMSSNLFGKTPSISAAAAASESSYQTMLDKLYTNLAKVVKNNG